MIDCFYRPCRYIVSLLIYLILFYSFPAVANEKPNFIIILFDDLGYNDVGYNGSEIKTPIIDALAKKSLIFDQFYVFPWCASTRAAVETGVNPAVFGMRSLEQNFHNKSSLPRSIPTLPERLKEVGYTNAFLGKWHLSTTFEDGPLNKGYDKAYGFLSGQMDHFKHDDHHGKDVLFSGDQFIHEDGHMTDLISREAIEFITNVESPFFMNISFSAPHYPIQPLQAFVDKNSHIENNDRRDYAGMVTHMDSVVGKLIEQLTVTDKLKNTYIFVFSDNGGQKSWANPKYYGGRFKGRKVMAINKPLRSYKTSAYEGGIRVPSFVYGPSIEGGHRTNEFATVLDVVSTILDISANASPNNLEGFNLLDLFLSPEQRNVEFFWQTQTSDIPYGGGRQEALRKGDFKLLRSQRRFFWFPFRWKFPWDKYELFDLSNDIGEKKDISTERPDLVKTLSEELDSKLKYYHLEFQDLLRTNEAKKR